MAYAAANDSLRRALIGLVSALTGFTPRRELLSHPSMLVVGFARVQGLVLIPLIAMRLFVEEKQTRTIEMLFTSPVRDREVIVGKWLGAMALYLLLLGLSMAALAVGFRWSGPDWRTVALTYPALLWPQCGMMAFGECLSMWTRHQMIAASGSFLACLVLFRLFGSGEVGGAGFALCAALTAMSWFFTWRSIQTLRGKY